MVPQLRFRHVGMLVRDIDRMAAFYKDILGFVETDRGTASGVMIVFLTRDPSAHHQLVLSSGLPEPSGATRALQQLSFMVDSLDDLRQMYRNIWDRRDVSGLLPTDQDRYLRGFRGGQRAAAPPVLGAGDGRPFHEEQLRQVWGRAPSSASRC